MDSYMFDDDSEILLDSMVQCTCKAPRIDMIGVE